MRAGLARLLAFIAIVEGVISVPVKWSGGSFLGVWGSGYLKAGMATLLLAIFFLLDDLRDQYSREHA
ncbi:MAG: hypothetical protein WC828_09690 [Thermoleophilia bacterium]|jgi:hypothetical protein